MAQIASDRSAYWKRLAEAFRIRSVVAGKKPGVTQMYIYLHHVGERSPAGRKNRGDVVDGLLRLLLNLASDEFPGDGINGSGPCHKNEIPRAPSLGVGALRRRAAFTLDHIFAHLVPFIWHRMLSRVLEVMVLLKKANRRSR